MSSDPTLKPAEQNEATLVVTPRLRAYVSGIGSHCLKEIYREVDVVRGIDREGMP
jgi:hypothetical protein